MRYRDLFPHPWSIWLFIFWVAVVVSIGLLLNEYSPASEPVWPTVEPVWPVVPPVVAPVETNLPRGGRTVTFEVADSTGLPMTITLEQPIQEGAAAPSIERLPGPRHSFHCLMCLGNWCVQHGGYSAEYLQQIGSEHWQDLADNVLNAGTKAEGEQQGSGYIGWEYGPSRSYRPRLLGRLFGR